MISDKPYILLIAPEAPPKLSAEAMQVRLILQELDKHISGHLVTTPVISNSWTVIDASMQLPLTHFSRQEIKLPMHSYLLRLFQSRYLRVLHRPDSESWIYCCLGDIMRKLPRKPDLIYSRSQPRSAAVLASRLKQKLNVPWIMHMSDPWVGDYDLESSCFNVADRITFTTHTQAEYYQAKYPALADRIVVTSNMIPPSQELMHLKEVMHRPEPSAPLRMIMAGSLYDNRTPEPFVKAVEALHAQDANLADKLQVDFYGNVQAEFLSALMRVPDIIHYHGLSSYSDVMQKQTQADVMLSIEPDNPEKLYQGILLVKMLNYMALGKPILSITHPGSESQKLCDQGYGWHASPGDPEAIKRVLTSCIESKEKIRQWQPLEPPANFQPENVAAILLEQIGTLTKGAA